MARDLVVIGVIWLSGQVAVFGAIWLSGLALPCSVFLGSLNGSRRRIESLLRLVSFGGRAWRCHARCVSIIGSNVVMFGAIWLLGLVTGRFAKRPCTVRWSRRRIRVRGA